MVFLFPLLFVFFYRTIIRSRNMISASLWYLIYFFFIKMQNEQMNSQWQKSVNIFTNMYISRTITFQRFILQTFVSHMLQWNWSFGIGQHYLRLTFFFFYFFFCFLLVKFEIACDDCIYVSRFRLTLATQIIHDIPFWILHHTNSQNEKKKQQNRSDKT